MYPTHLQLRKAVAAFDNNCRRRLPASPARLFNERQNLLTRWFGLEYGLWFGAVLPAAQAAIRSALGGTSNHMPVRIWREVGGWDEFNVTEDADLGDGWRGTATAPRSSTR